MCEKISHHSKPDPHDHTHEHHSTHGGHHQAHSHKHHCGTGHCGTGHSGTGHSGSTGSNKAPHLTFSGGHAPSLSLGGSSGHHSGSSSGGKGASSGPSGSIKPAPSVSGLNTDPNDRSHTLSSSAPAAIQNYKKEIEAASRETGVPADRIAAVIWAESRGNPNDPSRNPDGHNIDLGLMQINTETYGDVRKSQKGAPQLNLNNSADNIRAGAWELRDKYMRTRTWAKTHAAYRGVEDGKDGSYASAVEGFYQCLQNGKGLRDNGEW